MSQNSRNQPRDVRDSSNNSERGKRNLPDGFEGMNYEQRRPAYVPQRVGNEKGQILNGSEDKRHDEF